MDESWISEGEAAPPAPVELERTDPGPGAVCLTVTGEIDFSNSHEVRQAIAGIINEPGLKHLDLDLGPVKFIDSTGASVLLAGKRWAEQRDVGFAVVNPAGSITQVLELLGLYEMLAADDD